VQPMNREEWISGLCERSIWRGVSLADFGSDFLKSAREPINTGLSPHIRSSSKGDLRTIDLNRRMPHFGIRKALVCSSDQSKPWVTGGRRVTGLIRVSRAARSELLAAYFFGVMEPAILADMKSVRR